MQYLELCEIGIGERREKLLADQTFSCHKHFHAEHRLLLLFIKFCT